MENFSYGFVFTDVCEFAYFIDVCDAFVLVDKKKKMSSNMFIHKMYSIIEINILTKVCQCVHFKVLE